jgi:hypothetical protein
MPMTLGTASLGMSQIFFQVYWGAGAAVKSRTGSLASAWFMKAFQIGAANVPPNTFLPCTLRMGRSGV